MILQVVAFPVSTIISEFFSQTFKTGASCGPNGSLTKRNKRKLKIKYNTGRNSIQ